MPKNSNFHDWSYPEEGEQDWHAIVNPWIEKDLDEEVIKKDTRANQPSAGTQGRWYLVTDAAPGPVLDYDDGAEWVSIFDPADYVATDGDTMDGDLLFRKTHQARDLYGAIFADVGSQPTANGQMRRDGPDVKVYSGGSVRNMSHIGSGGGGSGFTQITTSGNTTASGNESHWVDTSNGDVTLDLPTPSSSTQIRIKHYTDGGTGNTCLVSGNSAGDAIDGGDEWEEVPLDTSYEFETDGNVWETH